MCDVTSYFAGCPKNEGHPWPHLRLVSYASADDLRAGVPPQPLCWGTFLVRRQLKLRTPPMTSLCF